MNYSARQHHHCIDVCNRLLRGELAALGTYTQVIRKFPNESATAELIRIRKEHGMSTSRLQSKVRELGGRPDIEPGAWGIFAHAIQGAANLFGEDAAISVLLRGEKYGRSDYEAALNDQELTDDCKSLVSFDLLPPIDGHIALLEQISRP